MAAFLHLSYLGAWQAHYDLKDPKGLAGFLIDSDIKLVRAESGSSDESSRHSGSRRHKEKWDARRRKEYMVFFACVVLFFHTSSRNAMEQYRTSLLGLI